MLWWTEGVSEGSSFHEGEMRMKDLRSSQGEEGKMRDLMSQSFQLHHSEVSIHKHYY